MYYKNLSGTKLWQKMLNLNKSFMKKLFIILAIGLISISAIAQRPRPHRPGMRPTLVGTWILENVQDKQQTIIFSDSSTFNLITTDYAGNKEFSDGRYFFDHGKITMNIKNVIRPLVFDFMWIGPKIRLSDDRLILIYRRIHPMTPPIPPPTTKKQ